MPNPADAALSAEDILARVLYRDGLVIVINKPAGMPVHAGFGGGPNMEHAFEHLMFGLPRAPSLAHRLDRDTSGCLVLGRHTKALRDLGQLFADGDVRKTYWAVVDGVPKATEGRVKAALSKVGSGPGWKMKVDPKGQPAITDYKVRGTYDSPRGPRAWIEFHPHTGRTHQIRVHSAELGCPIVGDKVYGRMPPMEPLMLHARAVTLPLYAKRDPIRVRAPVPEHMHADLMACGFDVAKDTVEALKAKPQSQAKPKS
jgi:RluA family pseudouridine synthase